MHGKSSASNIEIVSAYVHGRIEHEIESFATAFNCNAQELATRVAALLLGSGTRIENPMPASRVRSDTAKRRKPVEQVAVANRTSRDKAQHVGPKSGIAKWWASMSPDERKAEARRRRNKAKVKKAKNAKG